MIETVEEKIVLKDISDTIILKHLGYTAAEIAALIPHAVWGPDGFQQRLNRGTFAELFFAHVARHWNIFNKPCDVEWIDPLIRPGMSHEEKIPFIIRNATHGDCRFRFHGEFEPWRHVDVKMTSNITNSSLDRFRVEYCNDGWYMVNALSLTKNNYYMVRNNDDFRRAVRSVGVPTKLYNGDIMWDFLFNRLNKANYPCLEFFEMDPTNYRKAVSQLRREIQECVEPSLDRIDKLIKTVA